MLVKLGAPRSGELLSLCAVLLLAFSAPLCAADWEAWGPFGGSVVSLAVDPHDPSIVLAGARGGQLFRSQDHAATWHQVSFGRQLFGDVHVLAIDPSASSHYWAAISGENPSSNGLWESRDSGTAWRQHLPGLAVESLAIFPGDSSTVAAGTRSGLYVTNDGGASWRRITPERHPDLEDIVSLAFDRADARILYAGTPHLPWKTTDGGTTWVAIHDGMLDDSDVFSLRVSAASSTRLLASACSGIYRSEDAGLHWRMLDGIPNTSRRTHVVAEAPGEPTRVFAGTTDGLFRSVDAGAHWTHLNHLAINAIAFDRAQPNTLLLATERSGVMLSHDAGMTLEPANDGLHARNVAAIAASGSLLYLSTVYEGPEGGLFVASGTGWRKVGGPSFASLNIRSLAAANGRLFASSGQQILQSADGGRRWTPLPAQLTGPSSASVLTLAAVEGDVWAGTNAAIFRYASKAQSAGSWSRVAFTTSAVQAIRSSGAHVVARTQASAMISSDAGKTWKTVPATSLYDAAISCDGSALLATSAGLLAAFNGHDPVTVAGIPEGTVSAVAFHPSRCAEAYAAQFGRIYISKDSGLNWAPFDALRNLADVSSLWVPASMDNWLFATVPGAGVFRIRTGP